MGEWLNLPASDGSTLLAYRVAPVGPVRGALVVVQEIYGVNRHIRAVCKDYARLGFVAVAPALFERLEPGIELDYTAEGTQRGRALRTELGWDDPLRDIDTTLQALRNDAPLASIVGFCWGGSLAWLAACRLEVACAVGYYGAQIPQFVDERPRAPVLLHFGERDAFIPAADVAAIRQAHPDVSVHEYPAGHGFNCTDRADYQAESAELARARTLAFFDAHGEPRKPG